MIAQLLIIRNKFAYVLWALLVFSLPFTSLPLVVNLLGSDSVGSPSILLAVVLIMIWLLPNIIDGIKVSPTWIPILYFFFVALISTLISFFMEFPFARNLNPLLKNIEAGVTVMIGVSLFFLSSAFLQKEEDFRFTLRWLNIGAIFLLLWALLQFIAWYGFHEYPKWMFDIQGVISRRVLYRDRITGFALEPSWLAHMLNSFYLPVWLSASMKKISSFSFRMFGLSVENILLAGGIFVLFFTLSRVGYLAFFLLVVLLGIKYLQKLINFFEHKILAKRDTSIVEKNFFSTRKWIRLFVLLSFFALLIILVLISAKIAVRIDQRMARLFDFSLNSSNPFLEYFNNLRFGERTVYWIAGWKIFNDYPVMGVGLGNAGFFMPSRIIPYGFSMVEVRNILYREPFLLNIKSFWIRLLAETGMIGFSIFIAWYLDVFKKLQKFNIIIDGIRSIFISSGIFTLVTFLVEGFSIDSFAIPYVWVSLGVAIAAQQSLAKA